MLKRTISALVCSATLLLSPLSANADLISVDSGFSTLPGGFSDATFGGSGIPNDPMSWNLIDTNNDGAGDLLIAIGASQRYSSPVLTNDGSGNFFATPGDTDCTGASAACTTDGPRWNFNFFVESLLGPIADVATGLGLTYELDPNTPATAFVNLFDPQANTQLVQFSWNLGFAFLNAGTFGSVPAGETFDRQDTGTYGFSLVANGANGDIAVDMSVTTANAVSSPSTLAIFGLSMLALVGFRKRLL